MRLAEIAAILRPFWRRTTDKGVTTHDYGPGQRGPGHDFTFTPREVGLWAEVCGWGYGISEGDYLLLDNGDGGTSRYRVTKIRYFADPPDMWDATVEFAPRGAPA